LDFHLEISDSNPGRLGWDLWMGEGYPQLFIPRIIGPLVEPKKNQSIQVKSCNVLKGNMNIQIDGITMIAFHTHLNQIIVMLQYAKQNAPAIGH
jgi:hypothetical protein